MGSSYWVCGLLMLALAVCCVYGDRNSEKFRFDMANMRTSQFTRDVAHEIHSMVMDKYLPGNVLFNDMSAVKTSNGKVTQTVAGKPYGHGNEHGIGEAAKMGIITGLHQVNASTLLAVDSWNHCIRWIDRPTGQTGLFVGRCKSAGYTEGLSAQFNKPSRLIEDVFNRGNLLLADQANQAIRQINVKSRVVSTFFKHTLKPPKGTQHQGFKPIGLVQDTGTGDLYISSELSPIYRLSYREHLLTLLSGNSVGGSNGNFASASFKHPRGVSLIGGGYQLVVADSWNHRLRLLDLQTRTTSTIPIGLHYPYAITVGPDGTLYIGNRGGIVAVKGQGSSTPTRSTPKTTPSTTIKTTPSTTIRTTPSTTIRKTPPATLKTTITTTTTPTIKTRGPTTKASTAPAKVQKCPNSIRKKVVPHTRLATVEFVLGDVIHRLKLPVGTYEYQTVQNGISCFLEVQVYEFTMVRRLQFMAEYEVKCDLLFDPITMSTLQSLANSHFNRVSGICEKDCSAAHNPHAEISCSNNKLRILWPTNVTYGAEITKVPTALYENLTDRQQIINAKLPIFQIVIVSRNPPVIRPASIDVILTTSCSDGATYEKKSDVCR